MSFRLFGVNVEIQMSFWITSVILGLSRLSAPDVPRGAMAIWALVVFVSVLVHEMGHALAVMRHGIEPQVTLYAMGGLTRFQPVLPLSRRDRVLISLAGPLAGFALGGVTLALARVFPQAFAGSTLRQFAVSSMLWVNFGWGLVNLAPVLPFDGGHVLEQALGPKRVQLTALVSTVVAFLVAGAFVYRREAWGALLFGLAAVQSYRRFAASEASGETSGEGAPEEPVPPELAALLRAARHALGEEEVERACSLAQRVLEGDGGQHRVPAAARCEALEVIAWGHLLEDRAEVAAEVLAQIRRVTPEPPDAALEGAVLFALKDYPRARKILEAARAQGDDRKQIVGPLVQILIAQDEVGRAAEVALAVADSLSDDDVRRMAGLAVEHGAFSPAARLLEAIFNRRHLPEDAYEAARAEAQAGRPERALDLLRRAVEAGFSDRARVWSDAALATLQASPAADAAGAPQPPALEALLPRSMKVPIARVRPDDAGDLPLPRYQTEGAAGLDLHAAVPAPLTLAPGARALVPTGWAMAIPPGYEGQVRPRSGLALRHGVTVLNAPGTVDSDYRGELQVLLVNHGQAPFTVAPGDRIAQLVICQVSRAELSSCPASRRSARAAAGRGATGRRGSSEGGAFLVPEPLIPRSGAPSRDTRGPTARRGSPRRAPPRDTALDASSASQAEPPLPTRPPAPSAPPSRSTRSSAPSRSPAEPRCLPARPDRRARGAGSISPAPPAPRRAPAR